MNNGPQRLPPPRSELVADVANDLMTVLQERAGLNSLRPDEGLLAVELAFLTLFDNAMTGTRGNEDLATFEQERHMKSVVRISSRISAWPARPLDKRDRM